MPIDRGRLYGRLRALVEAPPGRGTKVMLRAAGAERHVLLPISPVRPVNTATDCAGAVGVVERYQEWLLEQEIASATFTPEQVQWLDAVKDHITSSLRIDQDSFDDVPFNQMGGLGRAQELFGEQLSSTLEELS